MVQWLLSANIRWPAVLVVVSSLVACGTTPSERRAETSAADWRVVERIGEARFSPPDAPWLAVITGRAITEGSEVTTGPGGRLILAAPGRHISVGPGSSFVLPRPRSDDFLEQRAGWLRYRMADALGEPFRIRTRSLDVEFMAAVLDIRVEPNATEITVKEGEVRIATPDGLRRTEIAAGQSVQASGVGDVQLALRRAPEDALEPLVPLVIPALRPLPSAAIDAATLRSPVAADAAGLEAAMSPPSTVDDLDRGPRAAARAKTIELAPATAEADRAAGAAGASDAKDLEANAKLLAAPGEREAAAARAVDAIRPSTGRRGKFERLTDGVIDDVQPFHPTVPQP
jgi:hypothetical protein